MIIDAWIVGSEGMEEAGDNNDQECEPDVVRNNFPRINETEVSTNKRTQIITKIRNPYYSYDSFDMTEHAEGKDNFKL